MRELSVPIWAIATAAALVVLALGMLLLAVRRQRRATAHALEASEHEVALVRERLAALEQQAAPVERVAEREPPAVPEREYLITRLGELDELDEDPGPETERTPVRPAVSLPAPVFADLLLRESAIRTASLASGVRRALAPEMLNRVRFEMRREVKRARKQRRLDLKQAKREWEQRQRDQLIAEQPR